MFLIMKTRRKQIMAEKCADQKGDTSDFTGCWITTESQEFIRRTFAFLPAKTLGICSRVCKAWHAEVKRVLHLREEIGWATFGRIQAEREADCATGDLLGPFGVNLSACLNTIGSLPRLAIMFSECLSLDEFQFSLCSLQELDFDDDMPTFSCASRKLHKPSKVVHSRLPEGSSVICVHTDGTIGCQADLSPAGECEDNSGVSCVLLPNIEGVTVDYQLHSPGCLTTAEVKAYIRSNTISADTQCVIVIYDDTYQGMGSYVRQLQRNFYDEFGTLPVISGGIARQLYIEPPNNHIGQTHHSSRLLTITFSGPKVKAASIVLNHRINTREKAHKKILELKKAGLSEKRSLAFMFSCVGRGQRFYQEEDVESGVFHKIFPNTPLLGFFGGGEYGCDNLHCGKVVRDDDADDIAKAYGKRKRKKMPDLERSLTCVVCLLSFG